MTNRVKSTGPHFIGIGAQKCGTTWLATNLGKHPDIWMPPRKELHYFDRSTDYPSPSIFASERPLTRLVNAEEHNRIFRRKMIGGLLESLRSTNIHSMAWSAKYYFGRCDDQWYTSLFENKFKNKLSGEITPAYSMLSREDVGKVYQLLPNAKIIYLIRNPIDRAWSQLRFETRKKGWPISSLTFDAVRERVDGAPYELRGDYIRTITSWRNYYPEDQFFVGFFDDIEEDPLSMLKSVFNFLGVDETKVNLAETAFRVVNPSPRKDMPDVVRDYLSQKYSRQMRELADLLEGPARTWFNELHIPI